MVKCWKCRSKIQESPYRNLVPVVTNVRKNFDYKYKQICHECLIWYQANAIPDLSRIERVEKYFVKEVSA